MNKINYLQYRVYPCGWDHHLEDSGWGEISKRLKWKFHAPESPIDMYTAYEYQVREKVYRPFVAFFHQVVSGYDRSLEIILQSNLWKHNRQYLLGAFVFSKHQREYFYKLGVTRHVKLVMHPTKLKVKHWNIKYFLYKKNFLHIGVHCRNAEFFLEVANHRGCDEQYTFLVARDRDYKKYYLQCKKVNVEMHTRLNRDDYNKALVSSVVFINLLNAAANNTVLECIARGTPILINHLDGIEDYLGKTYPLYYSDEQDVRQLINRINENPRILLRAHKYLLKIRSKYSIQKFLIDVKRGLHEMPLDCKL